MRDRRDLRFTICQRAFYRVRNDSSCSDSFSSACPIYDVLFSPDIYARNLSGVIFNKEILETNVLFHVSDSTSNGIPRPHIPRALRESNFIKTVLRDFIIPLH